MTTLAWGVLALLALRYVPPVLAEVTKACAAFERAIDGHDERPPPPNVISFPLGGRSAWRRKR
jgi:hypothetical protein